ncbi:hypothetical protein TanjilG_20407 [Lupinus angustifolius]|uniref:Translocase of chloroplast 159/132 membrane anchor domain-containing protein n=1 Tax=Lupinus angustifolius TaxID=3871 RepID=A0A4P1RVZ1_LUPAN|nr:hypothetical protein TanjilG_20407 [Lupinus angustifolius]
MDDPFLSSAEFFSPKSQMMPIAKVTLDDDDVSEEEDDDVFVEAFSDDNSFQTADFEGVHAVENGVDLHYDAKDEKLVNEEKEEERIEILQEREQGDGVDNNTLSGENGNSDSLAVELAHDDNIDKSKHVVHNNVDFVDKNDSVVFNRSDVADKNDGDDKNGDVVKFNGVGGSILENAQVNVSEPSGGDVVEDKVEQGDEKESEIEGVEAPAPDISLENGFNPVEEVGSEGILDNDNKVARLDTESSQIVDTGDDDVKNSDIVPLEKDESVEAVQDDINIEDHANEGELGPMLRSVRLKGDNPAYRYRFLEPTSQLLTRPVLDTQSWDHDCGYDGVNLEQTLAIVNKFPAAVTVQITKDKKDFNIHLDSSVVAKYGENGSTMAGFDIQNIGQQLAYIVRGETKFKNFKRNKTAAGLSVTFLGENVSTSLKVEDQIALGKRLVLVGSTGTVRCQGGSVYGANVEVRLREADFPIGQDQSSLSLSLVKWRGDLALGANFQSQFSLGRSYKMGVRAGLNNKLSGQISVRTSSSDQLQIALIAILPIARAIYKNFWTGASENYSIY